VVASLALAMDVGACCLQSDQQPTDAGRPTVDGGPADAGCPIPPPATCDGGVPLFLAAGPCDGGPYVWPSLSLGSSSTIVLSAYCGSLPYSWSLLSGTLPPGYALQTWGEMGGVPTQVGSFEFVVGVSDAAGSSASVSFELIVAP
jgi:Putative Ig domain